ncbi:MAG TPA: methyltransferase domain-containing protein [Saprospiraceae bacterium]|nr:methyltransferase domain-containing protein [Saprospiraceae bacterium]
MHPDVQTYYALTGFDYRIIWAGGRNLAVHFGYYDEHANRHQDALDNLNRALADYAGIRPGERVLDAGCGRGSAVFWLAAQHGCAVTGVNISAEQLAECTRTLDKKPHPGISFVRADYLNVPLPGASFDLVWACESLCHTAGKHAFYDEAFRLLRPGGRLVIAEYVRSGRPLSQNDEWLLEQWLRPWAIPDLDTLDEHHTHALGAGFRHFSSRDVTSRVKVSLRNLHRLCRRWQPWGRLMLLSGLISRLRYNNVCASIRQYEALEKGCWEYRFLLAEK